MPSRAFPGRVGSGWLGFGISGMQLLFSFGLRVRFRSDFERAGKTACPVNTISSAPLFQSFRQSFGSARIGVAGSPHLNGGSSCEEKLDGIFGGDNAAKTKDGNADGAGGFLDHA